jgi:hypothetical protein
MGWIFRAYASVYHTAMLQDGGPSAIAADAQATMTEEPSIFARIFGRVRRSHGSISPA